MKQPQSVMSVLTVPDSNFSQYPAILKIWMKQSLLMLHYQLYDYLISYFLANRKVRMQQTFILSWIFCKTPRPPFPQVLGAKTNLLSQNVATPQQDIIFGHRSRCLLVRWKNKQLCHFHLQTTQFICNQIGGTRAWAPLTPRPPLLCRDRQTLLSSAAG